jgi:hypothetical protein
MEWYSSFWNDLHGMDLEAVQPPPGASLLTTGGTIPSTDGRSPYEIVDWAVVGYTDNSYSVMVSSKGPTEKFPTTAVAGVVRRILPEGGMEQRAVFEAYFHHPPELGRKWCTFHMLL